MNPDALFWQLADSGEFSDAELVALSRLLDLFAALGMARVTLTYEQLAALWGYKIGSDDKSVRNMLSAFRQKVPWLGVIYHNKNAVLGLRWDRVVLDEREDRGRSAEHSGKITDVTVADGNSAVNEGNSAERIGTEAENPRKVGGTIGGDAWLLAFNLNPIRVSLLVERDISHLGANNSASNQASNKGAPISAILPQIFRADSALFPREVRAGPVAERTFRAYTAQIPRKLREDSAPVDVPDDLLRAVLDALDALPPENGVSEASARTIIAEALARGVAPEAVLAVALAVGARAETGGQVGGGLFRSLVGKPDPAREVPRAFLAQAREILGLEAEERDEGEEEARADVEIVGEPPYDPQAVWEKARERLREELSRADFNTWLRDAVLLAWEEGEFVIGVSNAFTKDWLSNRLNGQVHESLAQAAGIPEEEVSVRYVVDV